MATPHPLRTATVKRDTKETQIHIILCIDGGLLDLPAEARNISWEDRKNKHSFQESKTQYVDIDSGIGFLDHMLHALSKHAGWSVYIRSNGDLHSKAAFTTNAPTPTHPQN